MQKSWILNFIFFLVMAIYATPTFAQANGVNPFDIPQRLEQKVTQKDTVQAETKPLNPLEINRDGAIPQDKHALAIPSPKLLQNSWKVGGFMFGVFAFLIAFLSILMPFGRTTIFSFYRALTGAGPFNILYRNYGSIQFPVGIGLYLFYFSNMGLFVYLIGKHYNFLPSGNLSDLMMVVGIVAALSTIKQIIVNLLGSIFPIGKDAHRYSFLISVYSSIIGLFLFPFNLLLAYGPSEIRTFVIYLGVLMAIILFLYRYIVGTSSASQQVLRNKFNFFMYLCTLEIAPVLVLIKFLLIHQSVGH